MAVTPLISGLEESSDIVVATPGRYSERLQMSPDNLVGPMADGTMQVTQVMTQTRHGPDAERDFQQD